MALNKKSMFFTITAIALISLIVFSLTIYTSYKLRDKVMVTETRIYSMNSFIDDVEKDIERGLYISGFRALMSMEQYITCLLYTSPSPRDLSTSRMPSSA